MQVVEASAAEDAFSLDGLADSEDLLAGSDTGSCVTIFMATGHQTCVGQAGRISIPQLLSVWIFCRTHGITL